MPPLLLFLTPIITIDYHNNPSPAKIYPVNKVIFSYNKKTYFTVFYLTQIMRIILIKNIRFFIIFEK